MGHSAPPPHLRPQAPRRAHIRPEFSPYPVPIPFRRPEADSSKRLRRRLRRALERHPSGPASGLPNAGLLEAARTALGGSGPRGLNSLSVRANGRVAAAGCWDGRVRVYACRHPRLLASLQCHSKAVQCVLVSPSGRWLASASEDSRIALWDVYCDDRSAGSAAGGGPAAAAASD